MHVTATQVPLLLNLFDNDKIFDQIKFYCLLDNQFQFNLLLTKLFRSNFITVHI